MSLSEPFENARASTFIQQATGIDDSCCKAWLLPAVSIETDTNHMDWCFLCGASLSGGRETDGLCRTKKCMDYWESFIKERGRCEQRGGRCGRTSVEMCGFLFFRTFKWGWMFELHAWTDPNVSTRVSSFHETSWSLKVFPNKWLIIIVSFLFKLNLNSLITIKYNNLTW